MIRMTVALGALLAMFAGACRSGGSGPASTPTVAALSPMAAASACSPARPHAAGDFDQTIASGGLERTYILHVPRGYNGAHAVPLLLSFHGYGLPAKVFAPYVAFDPVADRAGFILVTPDGTGSPVAWNAEGFQGGMDDVAFVKSLLAKLNSDFCIDQRMVYAAGYSNGGGMVLRLACEMPDQFGAIGVVAATYVNCRAPVPLIAFHGTSDPLVPFEGSDASTPAAQLFPSVRRSVSEWARTLGCDGLPIISRLSSEVELSTFERCRMGNGDVLLYSILGGGHTWPGSLPMAPQIVGMTTQQIHASQVMWDFFAAHKRPG